MCLIKKERERDFPKFHCCYIKLANINKLTFMTIVPIEFQCLEMMIDYPEQTSFPKHCTYMNELIAHF